MSRQDILDLTGPIAMPTVLAQLIAPALYDKGWYVAIPGDGAEDTLEDANAAIVAADGTAIDAVVEYTPDYCDSVRLSHNGEEIVVQVLCNTATPEFTCTLDTLTDTIWQALTEYHK